MTDDAAQWPSFSDELTRKCMETLTKWMDRVDQGNAGQRDLYIVADVLWDAMSGLGHKQELRLLEQIIKEIKDDAKAHQRANSAV